MKIEDIAKVCHQANKAFCESNNDFSQEPWEFAPMEQKQSAFKGVVHVAANPDVTPEESHESWLALKEKNGWTYDKVKDEQRKVHPCMVPYDELPAMQQAKDELFISICKALLPLVDWASSEPAKEVEEHPDTIALAMEATKAKANANKVAAALNAKEVDTTEIKIIDKAKVTTKAKTLPSGAPMPIVPKDKK